MACRVAHKLAGRALEVAVLEHDVFAALMAFLPKDGCNIKHKAKK